MDAFPRSGAKISSTGQREKEDFTFVKYFVSRAPGVRCDTETAIREMNRYCEKHPRGPAAVRRPQLFIRGANFVVLLGRSVGEGIVGLGSTVSSALRAFEVQYLRSLRPDLEDDGLLNSQDNER